MKGIVIRLERLLKDYFTCLGIIKIISSTVIQFTVRSEKKELKKRNGREAETGAKDKNENYSWR